MHTVLNLGILRPTLALHVAPLLAPLQIALMSQIEMNREKLLAEHVLLPMIELLRSDDDVLLLAVAKVYTTQNPDPIGGEQIP